MTAYQSKFGETITIFVLILFVLAIIDTILSASMLARVNERLPEDQKLAWWRRDIYWGKVNDLYREQSPKSVLPDLEGNLRAAVLILFVIVFFILLWSR
jgi:hypothetical protein